jgi:hypothetical protein
LTLFVCGVLLCSTTVMRGTDVTLNGVVNAYAPVIRIEQRCSSLITIDATTGFAAGDRVVVMQMQGATVDRSNTNSHGRVVSLQTVGQFEFATIASFDTPSRTIHLRELLSVNFDVAGRVQIIRVATATNATITGTVRAQPWNGRVGGVVALEISNEVRLAGTIDVRDCGFAGGALWNGGGACSVTDVNGATNSARVAAKGQGIALNAAGFEAGRGCWANGGGGGAAHNAGGGGGGSAGAGGKGGNQWINCGATADNGGLGGVAIPFDPAQPRLVMGGGGGSGQQNDRVGTAGVRGAGIVLVRCASLLGDGQITASGSSVTAIAQNDGAGGGGAAGAIWIQAAAADPRIRVELHGGNGGSTRTGAAHGPGGGGGGGLFVTSWQPTSPDITPNLAGGLHGENLSISGANRTYLSQSGNAGTRFSGATLPDASPSTPPSIRAPADTLVCAGTSLQLAASVLQASSNAAVSWNDAAGRQVASQSRMTAQVQRSTFYVCTVVDGNGCSASDTVRISVAETPTLALANLDLGVLSSCRTRPDTAIWLYNRGITPALITRVRVSYGSAAQGGSQSTTLLPGDSLRIKIPLSREVSSPITVDVEAGPCDTALSCNVRWLQDGFSATIDPPSVVVGPFLSCQTVVLHEQVTVHVTGDSATVIDYIEAEDPVVTWVTTPRQTILPSVPLQLHVRVVANHHRPRGRVGIVLEAGDCIDTVWCNVEVTFHPPMFSPDTLDVGVIDRCTPDATYPLAIASLSDSSFFVARVVSTSPSLVVVRHSPSLSSRGLLDVELRYAGGNDTTAVLDVYLAECDSVVSVVVRWTYVGAQFAIDPAAIDVGDSIVCNERIVEVPVSIRSVVGAGTITHAIVQGAPVDVEIPEPVIGDGEEQRCRIRWTMPRGQGRERVGFVVASGRCTDTLWVELQGITRLPALRVTELIRVEGGTVGATENRILLVENPSSVDIVLTSIVLPGAPFSLDTIGIELPRLLPAGDELTIPVLFLRTCGEFRDSVVVHTTIPCAIDRKTSLEMDVSTTTSIQLVSVEAQAGGIVEIPVVIAGRPDAVPELTTSFTLTLQMDKAVAAPLPDRTPGLVEVRYDDKHANVTCRLPWNRMDTIARIPVLAMLASTDQDAIIIPENGFEWSGIDCQFVHSPAIVTLGPPCAGRELRMVRLGGAITAVRVSPVPAADWIDIAVEATDVEEFEIFLTDVTGHQIVRVEGRTSQPLRLPLYSASSGVAVLSIRSRFEVVTVPTLILR